MLQGSTQIGDCWQPWCHVLEGVKRLTLNCLHRELPWEVMQLTGLEKLEMMFHDCPLFGPISYPEFSSLQGLTALSINAWCDNCEEGGSFPSDLDNLRRLVSFEGSVPHQLMEPIKLGTQLTKLRLNDLNILGTHDRVRVNA